MALIVNRPKGTNDIVPEEVYKWHTVEKLARDTAEQFGFREIRIPTFEYTGLFVRSVGETTDVVQKEMYSVSAGGSSKYALRPEGTAGTMRAIIQNGILNNGFPQKVFYILSCFRHENTQAGRLREFHQFGCEMVGTESPRADAEVISLAKNLLDRVGVKNIELNINSIGCPECRAEYHKALKEFLASEKESLCSDCQQRLEKNPMRVLDCKNEKCQEIVKNAPLIIDYLCDDCKKHFEDLQKYLKIMGIEYKINPKIVRGLDYYTRTVFEFVTTSIGAQSTVCGGGRYDGLIEELGGAKTPALGFGLGLERLILTMENQGCDFGEVRKPELYIAPMGDDAMDKTLELVGRLREEGYFVEYDLVKRGIKPQMKYADKIGAKFVLVLGGNEISENKGNLKNMRTGEQIPVALDDKFVENFANILHGEMFTNVLE